MPLTELQIKKAKPTEKPYTLSDGLGLSLLVEPNGSKAWRFRYRFDGKPKMLSLGTYEHVSLADARQRRDESRRLVASGVNPSTLRKEQKAAKTLSATNTFEAITREWYEHRYDRWSASYRTEMMDTFEKDVFPYLGFRPIAEIKPLELLAMLRQVERRGVTEKVRKVRQRCGEVFRYAIITGRAEYNPAPDLASAMKPHKANNYAHLAAHELPEFLSELNAYTGSVITKIATQLLILTGLRPGEVRRSGEDIGCDVESSLTVKSLEGRLHKRVQTFNNIVLTSKMGFIFTYRIKDKVTDVIFDNHGFITGYTPFVYNMFPDMSGEFFGGVLISNGYHYFYDDYALFKVQGNLNTELVLNKSIVQNKIKAQNTE